MTNFKFLVGAEVCHLNISILSVIYSASCMGTHCGVKLAEA